MLIYIFFNLSKQHILHFSYKFDPANIHFSNENDKQNQHFSKNQPKSDRLRMYRKNDDYLCILVAGTDKKYATDEDYEGGDV